jgi:hypothetical protein
VLGLSSSLDVDPGQKPDKLGLTFRAGLSEDRLEGAAQRSLRRLSAPPLRQGRRRPPDIQPDGPRRASIQTRCEGDRRFRSPPPEAE